VGHPVILLALLCLWRLYPFCNSCSSLGSRESFLKMSRIFGARIKNCHSEGVSERHFSTVAKCMYDVKVLIDNFHHSVSGEFNINKLESSEIDRALVALREGLMNSYHLYQKDPVLRGSLDMPGVPFRWESRSLVESKSEAIRLRQWLMMYCADDAKRVVCKTMPASCLALMRSIADRWKETPFDVFCDRIGRLIETGGMGLRGWDLQDFTLLEAPVCRLEAYMQFYVFSGLFREALGNISVPGGLALSRIRVVMERRIRKSPFYFLKEQCEKEANHGGYSTVGYIMSPQVRMFALWCARRGALHRSDWSNFMSSFLSKNETYWINVGGDKAFSMKMDERAALEEARNKANARDVEAYLSNDESVAQTFARVKKSRALSKLAPSTVTSNEMDPSLFVEVVMTVPQYDMTAAEIVSVEASSAVLPKEEEGEAREGKTEEKGTESEVLPLGFFVEEIPEATVINLNSLDELSLTPLLMTGNLEGAELDAEVERIISSMELNAVAEVRDVGAVGELCSEEAHYTSLLDQVGEEEAELNRQSDWALPFDLSSI
jgi:hypothetical protein